jgi:hypothetical protein
MHGVFEQQGDMVVFVPHFPFAEDTAYALLVDGRIAGTIEHAAVPSTAPPTTVIDIYPSSAEVPLNLLRMFVQFSAPMCEGQVRTAIHVCRATDGTRLSDVLLNTHTELWDPDRRRLTLLLDPGRIKRGLASHLEAGYPLIEGVAIDLTVLPSFRDAEGRPLRSGATRRYLVGPPLRARVDPALWQFSVPLAGTRGALTVTFDRPLDRALLAHAIAVRTKDGAVIPGEATIHEGERSWQFEPHGPWASEGHALAIDTRLEDVAGNSLVRIFDRDLARRADDPLGPHGLVFVPLPHP